MAQDSESPETRPEPPPLKVVEREPDPAEPWSDDVLQRKDVAYRLTRIIEGQEAPFVISVDGRWGTGKTFLLMRWAQDLRNQDPKWQAIYYNAWEDDFADDPLLAIVAQFSEHGGPSLKQRARRLVEVAAPLLSYGVSLTAAQFGAEVPVSPVPTGTPSPEERLDRYLEKQAAKNKLKVLLRELAAEVRDETGQPLVFIIDELDRCRPTFAIELLERVKHIFDVPNLVFVFGINRSELTESLRSVYGEIDAGTYLRRFFDMEFTLPEPDPDQFCLSLLRKYGVDRFFTELDTDLFQRHHDQQFNEIAWGFPVLLGYMGFSLRDIDYCVRLLALATRDMEPRRNSYPMLLMPLIAVKISNPDLYRRFTQGDARGAGLIDHFNECHVARDTALSPKANQDVLVHMEAAVYCADSAENARGQLDGLLNGVKAEPPLYVSKQTAGIVGKSDPGAGHLRTLRSLVDEYAGRKTGYSHSLWSLTRQIDLAYGMTRR